MKFFVTCWREHWKIFDYSLTTILDVKFHALEYSLTHTHSSGLLIWDAFPKSIVTL